MGILLKNDTVLQEIKSQAITVFDKTGTYDREEEGEASNDRCYWYSIEKKC